MNATVPIGIAAIGALLLAARRAGAAVDRRRGPAAARDGRSGPLPSPEIRALIEREAVVQGVPPEVALAFAELESGFNPRAFGDRDWASRRPKQWSELLSRMPNNPAIDAPGVWGSYGLFGLLAAYHVQPDEHPNVLWDPARNVQRGVTAIKHALQRTKGDTEQARLLYVGCGADGENCSPGYAASVVARFRNALIRWRAMSATNLAEAVPNGHR